jgi:hypothetical protein
VELVIPGLHYPPKYQPPCSNGTLVAIVFLCRASQLLLLLLNPYIFKTTYFQLITIYIHKLMKVIASIGYDPNSGVCLMRTLGGPTVWVI